MRTSTARCGAIVLVVWGAICLHAHADNISLPLAGYFHPGRAMPVRWDVSLSATTAGMLQLSGSGAITTQMNWSGNPRGVVPWIVVDANLETIQWRSPSGNAGTLSGLRAIDESNWLVGSTLTSDSNAAALFPNHRIISIHLDAEDLKSSMMAWETLDALVLTAADIERISIRDCRRLIAQGTELVVQNVNPPNAELSWKRSGQFWIASAGLRLPPAIDSDAYAPTEGWIAGRSEPFRRRIFLLGAIYCLMIGGLYLWRSRWMPLGLVVITIGASAVFALENTRQSSVFHKSGTVRINDSIPLEDDWNFQVSHRPTEFRVPVVEFVHPIFWDESQVQAVNMRLECDGTGEPTGLSGQLSADEPLVLMARGLVTNPTPQIFSFPVNSPLRLLARESIYPQFSIAGQVAVSMDDDEWPTIVLSRQ